MTITISCTSNNASGHASVFLIRHRTFFLKTHTSKPSLESLESRDLCTVVHPVAHAYPVHHAAPVHAAPAHHQPLRHAAVAHVPHLPAPTPWNPRVPPRARAPRAAYYTPKMPTPTPLFSYVYIGQNWGMHLNDQLGDCVPASFDNVIITQTQATGHSYWPSDYGTLLAYMRVSGYQPGNPATDRGEWPISGIFDWERTGIDGHRAESWGPVNVHNIVKVEQAVMLYGATVATVALPQSAIDQYKLGQVWDVTPGPTGAPYSAGGHEVAVVGWSPTGPFLDTWGRTVQATWAWWNTYVTENDAVLTYDWVANGVAPNGLNNSQLLTDLHYLA